MEPNPARPGSPPAEKGDGCAGRLHKDAQAIDRKLIEKYGINVSESTRARRKQLGRANLQYIRYGQLFAILATKGEHEFFRIESGSIHDIRHTPLKVGGYSISYRRGGRTRSGEKDQSWHAHVEIDRRHYLDLKARFLDLATHRTVENLALEFYRIPFEPYAPVRRQLFNLWRAVNRARKAAGYNLIPVEVIPLRRRIVRPYCSVANRPAAKQRLPKLTLQDVNAQNTQPPASSLINHSKETRALLMTLL
jgi:hypothetical protein